MTQDQDEPPDEEHLAEWIRWLRERPEVVRKVVEKYPPWKNYRLKRKPGQRTLHEVYRIASYEEREDGTVTLLVDVHSPVFPRRVFGIKPETLEEIPA